MCVCVCVCVSVCVYIFVYKMEINLCKYLLGCDIDYSQFMVSSLKRKEDDPRTFWVLILTMFNDDFPDCISEGENHSKTSLISPLYQ